LFEGKASPYDMYGAVNGSVASRMRNSFREADDVELIGQVENAFAARWRAMTRGKHGGRVGRSHQRGKSVRSELFTMEVV